MIDVQLKIENVEQLAAAMQQLPAAIGGGVDTATRLALQLVAGQLAGYPPPPPGTRYRRTNLLGQWWSAATPRMGYRAGAAGVAISGEIRNARPGIGYVQGEEQAEVHRGRWRTAQQIVDEMQAQIDALLQTAGERAVNAAARK